MGGSQSEHITIHCSECARKLKVPAHAAGKRVKCPGCGNVITVAAEQAPAASPAADEFLRFNCDQCGAKMKVRSSAAGRRVRCPKCSSAVTVPQPDAPADEPPQDEWGDSGFGDNLLGDLASSEQSAGAIEQPDHPAAAPPPVPLSSSFPSAGGPSASSGSSEGGGIGGALGGLFGFVGPFALGCILSGVAAVIGGVVWTVVAMTTEREFGLLAWGIGGLTGFGMALGFRQVSAVAGAIAAAFALLSIVVSKFAIFMLVLAALAANLIGEVPADNGETDEEGKPKLVQTKVPQERFLVALWMTDDILDEWNLTNSVDRQKEFGTARSEAFLRVERMSDEEVLEAFDKYCAEDPDCEGRPSELEPPESEGDPNVLAYDPNDPNNITAGDFFTAFAMVMFRWMDVLFIGLAIVTAFRIGSQGMPD